MSLLAHTNKKNLVEPICVIDFQLGISLANEYTKYNECLGVKYNWKHQDKDISYSTDLITGTCL